MCLTKLVYRHRRLDNNKVFYVGVGGEKRPYSKRRNKHWQNVVNKTDYSIEIVAENLPLEDALELEMFLIAEYGIENLTNITCGGQGQFNPDAETRYKIGSGQRGKKHSEETKLKMSNSQKGRKHTKETKIKLKENNFVAKMVVDLQTGIFYNSLKSACDTVNINYKSEHLRITRYKNKYRFQYIS
jgi:hypothetical protein